MKPDPERAPGPTFDIQKIGFIDFESRGRMPISSGHDRYSRAAQAIMLAWAIGDGPVMVTAVADFSRPLNWQDLPADLRAFYHRAERGEVVFCAHNSGFDRAIWNNAGVGFPVLEPWMVIDTRVQATASGLPAALDAATRYAGGEYLKNKRGSALISLFCLPDSTATPVTHSDEWQEFITYAGDDVAAMRDLFRRTRQLPLAEWREFWAAERINDDGVGIDLALVAAAADMAREDQHRSAQEICALTNYAVTSVNQVARMVGWLTEVLPADGRDILIKRAERRDEDDEILTEEKTSLTRDRVLRLLAYLDTVTLTGPILAAQRVLQIRLYGGSKTPAKFSKMLAQHVDGVIRGQYVFNGASQTGRFSAKGIQVHNLMRDAFDFEFDAIDALLAGIAPDDFATLGDDTPISRKLSLLIRPALVAQPGCAFVWGDWSNIEARLVPWLARDKDAEGRLDVFRAVDRGEEKYDIYTRTAAQISGLTLDAVTPAIRQRGKVVELACGFGGAVQALLHMAASYGLHLEEEEAAATVAQWREANPWAVRFWGKHKGGESYGLWGALNRALENPGTVVEIGRVSYVFLKSYLGGSLLCRLPSGRYLTYRRVKWEYINVLDDDGNITDVRRELMFSRDMGRLKMWPGLVCENIVQATAADLLRGTLLRLDDDFTADWMPVRLHTHDEILVETEADLAEAAAEALRLTMIEGYHWSRGLPIAADTVVARFYTKHKPALGL